MTQIVNLWGGPGSGKSTTAALAFGALKMLGINCELVQEYIKGWVWEERKRIRGDQLYILAKQVRKEQILLDKVDVIVTDSPIWFSAFYDRKYMDTEILEPVIRDHVELMEEDGHTYYNFVVARGPNFNPAGRYENEEQSKQIDREMLSFMLAKKLNPILLSSDRQESIGEIVSVLQKEKQ